MANNARATKAVSGKDARYNDPEGVDNCKTGKGVARAAIVKTSPGKFERRIGIAVKATVKDKVTDDGKQMKGAMCTNTHNHAGANICVNNTTMATTPVEQWQRHQSNVGFG